MIGIIDYGVGNVQAVVNVYNRLNIASKRILSTNDFEGVTHLILPGVGDFDQAMDLFLRSGLKDSVCELVVHKKMPILGICVGMQMMATHSEEGTFSGLNWIPGQVRHFRTTWDEHNKINLPVPHMGWNDVSLSANSLQAQNSFQLPPSLRFYFLHSFYYIPDSSEHIWMTSDYGVQFSCAVKNNNFYGVQFHPEKSHRWGTALLKSFSEVSCA